MTTSRAKPAAVVLPPAVEDHPRMRAHRDQCAALEDAAAQSGALIRRLEVTRAAILAADAERQIGALLGDVVPSAPPAADLATLEDTDRRLSATRAQHAIEVEAVRRMTLRGQELEAELRRELAAAVDVAHRALLAELARAFAVVQPTVEQLRELHVRHAPLFATDRMPIWPELSRSPTSKLSVWLDAIRRAGVDVSG